MKTASSKKIPNAKKQLALYQKAYWGGAEQDKLHWNVFAQLSKFIVRNGGGGSKEATPPAVRMLYPGCHRHLTPLCFFSDITFVDYDSKVGGLYNPVEEDDSASAVLEYLNKHKQYRDTPTYRFVCADVTSKTIPKGLEGEYDLLVSLSAGCIAASCAKYIRQGGYLLVNDSHSDARMVYANHAKDFELFAYWDDETSAFRTDKIEDCFQVVAKTTKGNQKKTAKTVQPISQAQVGESIQIGAVRKRSFCLVFESKFYLFRRK